ncbi:UDP-3-O-acyl-N-acetylglucosamine deacetylase [Thiotrichales bacterium 19S3-7]|nr:UDP-3-O-acyl-N-acetylglucosamine deacetylase [Thiotrichales bacterium 19S3-7]MCF6802885.1 UDP-3-O-acyl-N-acetylglucosamine deacetylase [Thiotrichales bacterium 19S3-11]
MEKQQTIKQAIKIEGIGLHLGQIVTMVLKPAEVGHGIVFRRVDLNPSVDVPISVNGIQEALLCSALVKDNVQISTVEHLMSALCMLKVDNLLVEINSDELPVMDGSSEPFLEAIEAVGLIQQDQPRQLIKVLKAVRVEHQDKFAEVMPCDQTNYRFEIQWDHPVIASTPSVVEFDGRYDWYKKEVSRARTFGMVAELDYLHANNRAKGASLDNAVGITDEGVMNEEGLRYKDEFVKHKLLDAIGDFYVGGAIIGCFNCYKSGHHLNNMLLRKLYQDPSNYKILS